MSLPTDLSFVRAERLKHKKLFEGLFSTGQRSFKHPVLAIWSVVELPEDVPIQAGFVAAKKHYKTATQRNLIKRRMREAFRTQKHELEAKLRGKDKQIALLFITVKSDNISYEDLQPKILLLLRDIGRKIEHSG